MKDVINANRSRPFCQATTLDRLCDKCKKPMIGVMKISAEKTPRKVCHECGGKSVHEE